MTAQKIDHERSVEYFLHVSGNCYLTAEYLYRDENNSLLTLLNKVNLLFEELGWIWKGGQEVARLFEEGEAALVLKCLFVATPNKRKAAVRVFALPVEAVNDSSGELVEAVSFETDKIETLRFLFPYQLLNEEVDRNVFFTDRRQKRITWKGSG